LRGRCRRPAGERRRHVLAHAPRAGGREQCAEEEVAQVKFIRRAQRRSNRRARASVRSASGMRIATVAPR
jgi:hypothetical protein